MNGTMLFDSGPTAREDFYTGRDSCGPARRTRGELETLLLDHVEMLYLIALRFAGDRQRAGSLVSRTIAAALQAPELNQRFTLPKPWLISKLRQLHCGH